MPKDTPQEKQIKKNWIEDQIEYKNPNLPWNQPKYYGFPPLTPEQQERLKKCDQYGNPIKTMTLEDFNSLKKPRLENEDYYFMHAFIEDKGVYEALVINKKERDKHSETFAALLMQGKRDLVVASFATTSFRQAKQFITFVQETL